VYSSLTPRSKPVALEELKANLDTGGNSQDAAMGRYLKRTETEHRL